MPNTSTATTTASASLVPSTSIITNKTPKINIPDTQTTENGDHPNNKEEEGWTQVTRGKKSPSKAPKSPLAKTGENKNTEEEKENPQKLQKRRKKK